jgi:hypothetical protein
VGEVFKRHFSNGGTFLNFDWASFKNYYNEKFEKGKGLLRTNQRRIFVSAK